MGNTCDVWSPPPPLSQHERENIWEEVPDGRPPAQEVCPRVAYPAAVMSLPSPHRSWQPHNHTTIKRHVTIIMHRRLIVGMRPAHWQQPRDRTLNGLIVVVKETGLQVASAVIQVYEPRVTTLLATLTKRPIVHAPYNGSAGSSNESENLA